jgi:hypothetical protein
MPPNIEKIRKRLTGDTTENIVGVVSGRILVGILLLVIW